MVCRVFSFKPRGRRPRQIKLLVDGLHYATSVLLRPDEKSLLISELTRARIVELSIRRQLFTYRCYK